MVGDTENDPNSLVGSSSSRYTSQGYNERAGTGIPFGNLEWSKLSPRGLAILQHVALPIASGYSPTELARELGRSRSWIRQRLAELADELEHHSMPML